MFQADIDAKKTISSVHLIATNRILIRAVIVVAGVLVLISAIRFQSPDVLGSKKVLTDFDAFYLTGTMALEGDAAATYHAETMLAAQARVADAPSFLPWTYPPPFTLFSAGLALLPIGVSYALFVT